MATIQVPWLRNTAIGQSRWLRGWRGLALLATIAIAVGLAVGWNWLASVGALSLLFTALPCLAMCALGLCMHKMGSGKERSATTAETIGESSPTGKSCCRDAARTPASPAKDP